MVVQIRFFWLRKSHFADFLQNNGRFESDIFGSFQNSSRESDTSVIEEQLGVGRSCTSPALPSDWLPLLADPVTGTRWHRRAHTRRAARPAASLRLSPRLLPLFFSSTNRFPV